MYCWLRAGGGLSFLLCVLAAGCGRSVATQPVTIDDPNGPIVKTTGSASPGIEVSGAEREYVSYFANGFAKNATPEDRRAGRNEVRFYNPANVRNRVKFEVYFENRAPQTFAEFTMDPNNNGQLFMIPSSDEAFFEGSEAWAGKITSSAPILVQNGLSAGVVAPGGDLWFGDPRFKGGYASVQATRTLSTRWFFPDGLKLVWDSPGPGKLFQEYEWYHLFNPNKTDASVELRCHYQDGELETFSLTVKAERVRIVNNDDLVRANTPHAVEVVSSVPIAVSAQRFIYDFADTEDWGAWLHTSLTATPLEAITAQP